MKPEAHTTYGGDQGGQNGSPGEMIVRANGQPVHFHPGGLLPDCGHLKGGKALWKSFASTAAERGLSITVVDTDLGQSKPVSEVTTDDEIWSVDMALKGLVLVLGKPV